MYFLFFAVTCEAKSEDQAKRRGVIRKIRRSQISPSGMTVREQRGCRRSSGSRKVRPKGDSRGVSSRGTQVETRRGM